jgi:hypothetical protein
MSPRSLAACRRTKFSLAWRRKPSTSKSAGMFAPVAQASAVRQRRLLRIRIERAGEISRCRGIAGAGTGVLHALLGERLLISQRTTKKATMTRPGSAACWPCLRPCRSARAGRRCRDRPRDRPKARGSGSCRPAWRLLQVQRPQPERQPVCRLAAGAVGAGVAWRCMPKDLPPPRRLASASGAIMPRPTTAAKAAINNRFICFFSSLELVTPMQRDDAGCHVEHFDTFQAGLFHHGLERLAWSGCMRIDSAR